MRYSSILTLFSVSWLLIISATHGQSPVFEWYSETVSQGICIQNSYPKGGPYTGPTDEYFNHSYLVFFSRIVNETEDTLMINIEFSADAVAIPHSPDTYMKLFLPVEEMSMDKVHEFSYGVTSLVSLYDDTSAKRVIAPHEDGFLYIVALFYQTDSAAWRQERGGNRAELVLRGDQLYFKLPPQIDSLHCGSITFSQ